MPDATQRTPAAKAAQTLAPRSEPSIVSSAVLRLWVSESRSIFFDAIALPLLVDQSELGHRHIHPLQIIV